MPIWVPEISLVAENRSFKLRQNLEFRDGFVLEGLNGVILEHLHVRVFHGGLVDTTNGVLLVLHLCVIDDSLADARIGLDRVHFEANGASISVRSEVSGDEHAS